MPSAEMDEPTNLWQKGFQKKQRPQHGASGYKQMLAAGRVRHRDLPVSPSDPRLDWSASQVDSLGKGVWGSMSRLVTTLRLAR